MTTIEGLRRFLSRRDKVYLIFLALFSVAVSALETLSVFLIMSFVSIATNFDAIFQHYYLSRLYEFFAFPSAVAFVLVFGCSLIIFYGIRGFLNIFFLYLLNRYAQKHFYSLASKLFQDYIHFNYQHYVVHNSENIRKLVITDANYFNQILVATLMIGSELCTFAFLYIMLAWVNWKVTCVLTLLFTIKILLVVRPFFGLLEKQGRKLGQANIQISRAFTEAFGNFKLIKFLNNESFVVQKFRDATYFVSRAAVLKAVLESVPRFLVETLGFFILISVVMYVVYKHRDPQLVVPIVSMYAVAFYRFLPSINKILLQYNNLLAAKGAIDLWDYLPAGKVEYLGNKSIGYEKTLALKHISFSYVHNKQPVLSDINLTIQKGTKVAFTGPSGAGKSTLVDIMAGLYRPQKGRILIDNVALNDDTMKAWRHNIGYIPQSIYLFDGTVKDNVVFGRSYDEDRLRLVLKQACIYDFLSTKDGIYTIVGEGGVKLSGGQKQRIAIARALYSNPEILILDEATSALDSETESNIMDEIYDTSQGKTLLVVAHRLSTIKRCDVIYQIDDRGLHEVIFSVQGDVEVVDAL